MFGARNSAVDGGAPLAGLLADSGSGARGSLGDGEEFTQAMQEQLGGLLVDLGVDADRVARMDAAAMLAELDALLRGQRLAAAGGETLPLLDGQQMGKLGDGTASLDLSLLEESGLPEGLSLEEGSALAGALGLSDAEALESRAAMSLAALRLFLQAGGDSSEDASASASDAEAQAALAALLQQWVSQQRSGSRDAAALSASRSTQTDASSSMLAQMRDFFFAGGFNGATAGDESSRQFLEAVTQATAQRASGGENVASDGLSLLKAAILGGRASEQTATGPTDAGRPFDLSRLLSQDGARQFADKIAMIARAREGVAELKLHPPSLGAMEIRVAMDADRANIHFSSPNPVVREVLEAAMPRLREALAQDGLALGDASVSDQPPQRRDEAAQDRMAGDGGAADDDDQATDPFTTAEQGGVKTTLSALARKLDIFA